MVIWSNLFVKSMWLIDLNKTKNSFLNVIFSLSQSLLIIKQQWIYRKLLQNVIQTFATFVHKWVKLREPFDVHDCSWMNANEHVRCIHIVKLTILCRDRRRPVTIPSIFFRTPSPLHPYGFLSVLKHSMAVLKCS